MRIRGNMGRTDRLARLIAAIVLLPVAGVMGGGWGVLALVLGVVLLATAATGYCPLYSVFGVGTLGAGKPQPGGRAG